MNIIKELLSDNSGGLSSSRFQMLLWTFGVLGVWIYASVKAAMLVAIPETVLVLLLGVGTLKVAQRFGEKPDDSNNPK